MQQQFTTARAMSRELGVSRHVVHHALSVLGAPYFAVAGRTRLYDPSTLQAVRAFVEAVPAWHVKRRRPAT